MDKIKVLESIKLATKTIESFFSGVTPEGAEVETVETEMSAEVFETTKIKGEDKSISYAELVEGADVSISSGEGSEVAPDATYELENGISITVKDGKIESFIAPEEAETEVEELAEEAPVEDAPESGSEIEAIKADVTALTAKVDELTAMMLDLVEALKGTANKDDVAEFSSQIKTLNNALEVVINTPAEFSKTDNSFENREDKNNKIMRIAEITSTMKKR